MHELSICQSLLKEVARAVANQSEVQSKAVVTAVDIALGPLSGVDPGQLLRAFDLARRGTLAEAAMLRIEPVPVSVWCAECATESTVPPNALVCSRCGTWRVSLRSGADLSLRSVTLSDPDGPAPKDGTCPEEKTDVY